MLKLLINELVRNRETYQRDPDPGDDFLFGLKKNPLTGYLILQLC